MSMYYGLDEAEYDRLTDDERARYDEAIERGGRHEDGMKAAEGD